MNEKLKEIFLLDYHNYDTILVAAAAVPPPFSPHNFSGFL